MEEYCLAAVSSHYLRRASFISDKFDEIFKQILKFR